MAKTRISTNVEHSVAKDVETAADALGMSVSAWLAMAAESELKRLDARKLVEQALQDAEQARRERDAAQSAQVDVEQDRDTAQDALKQVASHLGVPDTAKHCKQRIDEINAYLTTIAACLGDYNELENPVIRDFCLEKINQLKQERDTLQVNLKAWQRQSWWRKLFGIKPIMVESVRTVKLKYGRD